MVISSVLVSLLLSVSAQAQPSPMQGESVEIPVRKVFAPMRGYDDNDLVEVVLWGYLPNGCYQIAQATVDKDSRGMPVRIHQMATKSVDGVCANQDTLPDSLKYPVPFTTELVLGNLPMGDFTIEYNTPNGKAERTINIAHAEALTIDNQPYASVSNAQVREILPANQDAVVTITGVLNNSCAYLTDDFEVVRQPDVMVLLPVVRYHQNTECAFYLRPFERTVNLGKLEPGRYLLHVRSQQGKAVNRLFFVGKSELSNPKTH